MRRSHECWLLAVVACGAVLLGGPSTAWGNVDLGFDPANQTVNVGDLVSVGLIASSDDDTSQSIYAMDVILDWDPTVLELIDHVDEGPIDWLFSGFPPHKLNDTWLDGYALYEAITAVPGDPVYAPPEGLLVTVFRFMALAPTELTTISIPESVGEWTTTFVLDGFTPGLDVTGELGMAELAIVPEPISLSLFAVVCVGFALRRCR